MHIKHILSAALVGFMLFGGISHAKPLTDESVPGKDQNDQVEKPVAEKPQVQPRTRPPMQRPWGAIFGVNKQLTCNDTEVIENHIKSKYREVPLALGLTKNAMGVATVVTMIYVNPRTRDFTIVEHAATRVSCILGSGNEFQYMHDFDILDPEYKPDQHARP